MKQSQLFSQTRKSIAAEEVSINAQLLLKAGFVEKVMAGVYAYLPLGYKVVQNIITIVREEMEREDAQEILMPALQPKEYWEKTGRWDGLDVLFKVKSQSDKEYALGPTHEEVVTPLAQQHLRSYRDMNKAVFQIQTKFRDEPRAKSGLLRGREFIMKDLYSFHATEEELDAYYDRMRAAYARVYKRLGVDAKEVFASGGTFSKFSHEYQVFTDAGEDLIYYCADCGFAVNKEIAEQAEGDTCSQCNKGTIVIHKAIEVGNIFKLMQKYSAAFDYTFTTNEGKESPVIMGCYGIGVTRLLGTIVEVHHDEKGIQWPDEVAPFRVHLVQLGDDEAVKAKAEEYYSLLKERGVSVLWDDRGLSAGAALGDADMIGLPIRVVISKRTLEQNGCEVKLRKESEARMVSEEELLEVVG